MESTPHTPATVPTQAATNSGSALRTWIAELSMVIGVYAFVGTSLVLLILFLYTYLVQLAGGSEMLAGSTPFRPPEGW
jgi:hypothetical protein